MAMATMMNDVSTTTMNKLSLILGRLGLNDKYPQKLAIQDILLVGKNSTESKVPNTEDKLPLFIMQRLLALDVKARNTYICPPSQNQFVPTVTDNQDDTFDFDDLMEVNETAVNEIPTHLHPSDVAMAIFLCSDNFLRQYMFKKLSECLVSVPLFVPNPETDNILFPLWSLRSIRRSWKTCDQTKFASGQDQSIVNVKTHMVTFMRIGSDPVISKSQIINEIMSRSKHDIFLHRHCESMSTKRVLSDGIVEVSWYLPGGKTSDPFDEVLTFVNVRGDATLLQKQVNILKSYSSVLVVFVSHSGLDSIGKQMLNDLVKSPTPVMCLLTDKSTCPTTKTNKIMFGIQNKSISDLQNDISSGISSLLQMSERRKSLLDLGKQAQDNGFEIDETEAKCESGKQLAMNIIAFIGDEELAKVKSTYLPLQGASWHEWCKKDKEMCRLREIGGTSEECSIEQYRSSIRQEMRQIRQKQLKQAFPLNNVMRSFIDILRSNDKQTRAYFLQWLKSKLDETSSIKLPKLHQQCHEQWTKVSELKDKKVSEAELEKAKYKLKQLYKKLVESSFGLEHLLREVAQVYESIKEAGSEHKATVLKLLESLPSIAANLLISGSPLELMDGDAAHVPISWIRAVLAATIEKIGDAKVFVLSVLGIQSSGKSTMLNAMFGMQFAVSAGRCTKGAFMQLLKVDPSIQDNLHYDYIIVIDTEGLKAPEMTSQETLRHDNELATFVIGLGDVTLINIFGENPSEMHDILQIAVQAFLRMKQIKLNPSCHFVHQNVQAVDAKSATLSGRRNLLERLDEMTKLAAGEERRPETRFTEVIQFDVNKQAWYFSSLWQGNPPMAAPNPGYSADILSLKEEILNVPKAHGSKCCSSLQEVNDRMHDLWNALKFENFVFSFKNTLAISTWNQLEEEIGKQTWELRTLGLKEETTCINKIKSDITCFDQALQDFDKSIIEKMEGLISGLEKFITNHSEKDLMVQWKEETLVRIRRTKTELLNQVTERCRAEFNAIQARQDIDDQFETHRKKLLESSKKLALSLRGSEISTKQIEQEFEKLWKSWIREVGTARQKENVSMDSIRARGYKTLHEFFNKHQGMVIKRIEHHVSTNTIRNFKPRSNNLVKSHWFKATAKDVKEAFESVVSSDSKTVIKRAANNIKDVADAVDDFLRQKELDKVNYKESYFHYLLDCVNQIMIDFEKVEKSYEYEVEFRIDVCILAIRQASNVFICLHQNYTYENSPLRHLEEKKDTYYKLFLEYYLGASTGKIAAIYLCDSLKDAILEVVFEGAARNLAEEMRLSVDAFSSTRTKVNGYILLELLEEKDFKKYMKYIQQPEEYFRNWVKGKTERFAFLGRPAKFHMIIRKHLQDLIKIITLVLDDNSIVKNGKFSVDTFCSHGKFDGKLPINRMHLLDKSEFQDADVELLINETKVGMNAVKSQIDEIIMKTSDFTQSTVKPHEMIQEHLRGCWETCPFCNVPCTHGYNHGKDHSVQYHRPECLIGCHWGGTDQFSIDICSSSVTTDNRFQNSDTKGELVNYKDYRSVNSRYRSWSILPEHKFQTYWKWFVWNFRSDLEQKYSYKFKGRGSIPSDWQTITEKEVEDEIRTEYQITA